MKKLVPITETHYEVYYYSTLLGDAIQDVDGYFYFQFKDLTPGLWAEDTLKAITDSLHELNKDWDEKINEYFIEEARLKNRYKNISTEQDYNLLLRSGMF